MNQHFRSSAETDKIDAALAKAQAKIKPAIKDAQNPHFKSNFATYASIFEACRGPFSEAGIAILAAATSEGKLVTVTTRLAHAGQFYEADLSVELPQLGAQQVGSAISYLKRYGLAALAGVPTADEDDDGEAAVGRPPPAKNGADQAARIAAMRAKVNDPKARSAAVLAYATRKHGGDARAKIAKVIGRTLPVDAEVVFTEEELKTLEAQMALSQATDNAGAAAH